MKNELSIQQFLRFRIWFTVIVSFTIWTLLTWQYFDGEIPSHHFLAREDMPLISNIWGALIIPSFTWFLLYRIGKRIFRQQVIITFPYATLFAWIGAMLFGIALGLSIYYEFKTFSSNVPLILFVLALLFPTYRSEYLLGFVLGLTYFIGGVLPVVVGSVFLLFSAGIHLYLRKWIIHIFNYLYRYVK